ncbi:MAG TPA: hypothetical protein VN948_17455 [Terriglobales bacterium]|nr:hypothetical protein [Terriglobales bacterium]
MSDSQSQRTALQVLLDLWHRIRRKPHDVHSVYIRGTPPTDPYAYRLVPVRRGPKGRSGAAVAEPEDDSYRSFPPRRT